MTETITVRKLDAHGQFVLAYTGALAETLPNGIRLDARWERAPLALGYTTFETGDHFIEDFFTDRWYNIIEIRDSREQLKGWYCNICAPATIEAGVITYRDLLLDVWVAPNGVTLTLDDDEFEAETTLDTLTHQMALAGLEALLALVSRREPPFARLI